MTPTPRIIPLLLAVLLSACINLPEVAEPETPDAGTPPPDAGVPTDTTAPTITATQPPHGSTNVVANGQLVATFSEPMNVSTVQYSLAPSQTISGATWSAGNTQLTLQPTAPLALNTNYTLTVDGKDVAGNALSGRKTFSFTTAGPAPDTTPPVVLGSTPGDTAIGVARNASLTVMFSEPMDKPTAQAAFAILSPSSSSTGVFTWNPSGTEMTFNPDTDFPYGTDVAWRVSTAAKDPAGNVLTTAVTEVFRTVRTTTTTIVFNPATSGSALTPDYYKDSWNYRNENVGDYGNDSTRLLLGFKLDSLPTDLVAISQAKLKWHATRQIGDTFGGSLGRLLLEHVYIGNSIALSTGPLNPQSKVQYESAGLSSPLVITPSMINEGINVTAFASDDWQERANRNSHSQFRLRFEIPNNNNNKADQLQSDFEITPVLAELELTYEYP